MNADQTIGAIKAWTDPSMPGTPEQRLNRIADLIGDYIADLIEKGNQT